MITAISTLTLLGIVLGSLLGMAARYLKVEGNPLVAELEEMMPGSQCGQCGYPGCGPAAEALAEGDAEVSICPPGGRALAAAFATKLGIVVDLTAFEEKLPTIAFVNEDLCIGCTRCFQKCPTDALVGGPKQMHTVVSEYCTGCEECMNICPTECIEMVPLKHTVATWHWPKPELKTGVSEPMAA